MFDSSDKMKREIVTTKDGSKTIYLPEINESYHSRHGAYQEAMHVFIKSGWEQIQKDTVSILEVGFGTGLNAVLTYIAAKNAQKQVKYVGLEAFPVEMEEIESINYKEIPAVESYQSVFLKMHQSKWEEAIGIDENFTLQKIKAELESYISPNNIFDLIYFDAFGPRVQPEMWSLGIFKKLFDSLNPNGIFVTYSCKGQVRRDLITAGFEVEKIPGPPGKREMLRAVKR